jgi:hypothetical protein
MRPIVLVAVALAGMSLTSTFAMPAHGAGPLDWAVRIAAIPRQRNAWLRCAALGAFATLIHSPGRSTGPRPGAGIPPTRHGAIGALISAEVG